MIREETKRMLAIAKTMFKKYFTWRYYAIAGMGILCTVIHVRIGERTFRSFAEIFYWPNGICADMIVTYGALLCFEVALLVAIVPLIKDLCKGEF